MTNHTTTLATRSGFGRTGLLVAIIAFIDRRRRNRALREVMKLDEHLLRDIGLSRGDIAAMMR